MADRDDEDDGEALGGAQQRLDKWLWYARVHKSRTLAASAVSEGRIRVNKVRAIKPAQSVKPGDVLTIALREKLLILKVLQPGRRRGPPAEAHTLYEDLSPPPPARDMPPPSGQRDRGAGRPSKRDRREIDRLKRND